MTRVASDRTRVDKKQFHIPIPKLILGEKISLCSPTSNSRPTKSISRPRLYLFFSAQSLQKPFDPQEIKKSLANSKEYPASPSLKIQICCNGIVIIELDGLLMATGEIPSVDLEKRAPMRFV